MRPRKCAIGVKRQPQGILAWMPKTLSIVGAGRVGRALGRRLHELGWKIGVVSARTEASARKGVRFIGAGQPAVGITPAVLGSRTILLTVPDDAIALVADELAHIGGEQLQGKVVLHASGALDAGVLAAVRNCGASVGSMHPLQTFSGTNRPALEGKDICGAGRRESRASSSKNSESAGRNSLQHRGREEGVVPCRGCVRSGTRVGAGRDRRADADERGNETRRSGESAGLVDAADAGELRKTWGQAGVDGASCRAEITELWPRMKRRWRDFSRSFWRRIKQSTAKRRAFCLRTRMRCWVS